MQISQNANQLQTAGPVILLKRLPPFKEAHTCSCAGLACHLSWRGSKYRWVPLDMNKHNQAKSFKFWVNFELSMQNNTPGIEMWNTWNKSQFRFKHIRIKRDPPVNGSFRQFCRIDAQITLQQRTFSPPSRDLRFCIYVHVRGCGAGILAEFSEIKVMS